MVKVYDNLQEEIKLKGEDILKLERSLESGREEINDLQSEFQAERTDYLDTIRKMERELLLQNQIIGKIQPLVRRDCNYSNIERMKILAEYDDENEVWKIPDVKVDKVSLPKTGPGMDSMSTTSLSSAERNSNTTEYNQRGNEVDKYAQHILSTQNEQYANEYFKPKRADKLLSGSPSSSLNLNNNNSNANNPALAKLQPLSSPSATSMQDPMLQRRPQKLEALPASAFEKKKKKNKIKDQY